MAGRVRIQYKPKQVGSQNVVTTLGKILCLNSQRSDNTGWASRPILLGGRKSVGQAPPHAVPSRKRVRHNVFVDSPRRSLAAQSGAKFYRIGSPEQVRPSVWDSPFRSSLMSTIPVDAVQSVLSNTPYDTKCTPVGSVAISPRGVDPKPFGPQSATVSGECPSAPEGIWW